MLVRFQCVSVMDGIFSGMMGMDIILFRVEECVNVDIICRKYKEMLFFQRKGKQLREFGIKGYLFMYV